MRDHSAWVCVLLVCACATTDAEGSRDDSEEPANSVSAKLLRVTSNWEAKRPAIAADAKGTLHVAYQSFEKDKPVPDIFYTRSTDEGHTWSPGVCVSRTPGVSDEPAIAVTRQGGILVVWTDTTSGAERPDVFSSRSTDGGKTWSKAVDISNTRGVSSQPAVTIARDHSIHVVWKDTTDSAASPDVWYSSSRDSGNTWSTPHNISHTPGVSNHPTVAIGPEGAVYVAWVDTTDGASSPDIWFVRSTDGGGTWGKAKNVSHTTGISSDPELATDSQGSLYLAWYDTTAGKDHPDIFFSSSHDGGGTFSPYLNLSQTPRISSALAIAAGDQGQVAVAWRETSNPEDPPDIWFASSVDAGRSFTGAENLSKTPGVTDVPHVVITKGVAYIIWDEYENERTMVKMSREPLQEAAAPE